MGHPVLQHARPACDLGPAIPHNALLYIALALLQWLSTRLPCPDAGMAMHETALLALLVLQPSPTACAAIMQCRPADWLEMLFLTALPSTVQGSLARCFSTVTPACAAATAVLVKGFRHSCCAAGAAISGAANAADPAALCVRLGCSIRVWAAATVRLLRWLTFISLGAGCTAAAGRLALLGFTALCCASTALVRGAAALAGGAAAAGLAAALARECLGNGSRRSAVLWPLPCALQARCADEGVCCSRRVHDRLV